MVVEQMEMYHSDVLLTTGGVKVQPVEIMDHLDENHKPLDQMESIRKSNLIYFSEDFLSMNNNKTQNRTRAAEKLTEKKKFFFFVVNSF
jgi:hypothetical protein